LSVRDSAGNVTTIRFSDMRKGAGVNDPAGNRILLHRRFARQVVAGGLR
jgi:hypothetical protein